MVRDLGDYTDKLIKQVHTVSADGTINASIEGPYGGLALSYADYRVLHFIAGGIGMLHCFNRNRHKTECLLTWPTRYYCVTFVVKQG